MEVILISDVEKLGLKGDVVDVKRNRHPVRAELDTERLAVDDRERHGAGLELGTHRGAPGSLPARAGLEPDDVRVELDGAIEILRRHRHEVDTADT